MTHHQPSEPSVTKTQPVGLAELVRMVVVLLVGVGWLTLDDAAVNTVVSVAGMIASIALTWWTDHKVTPTARPRSAEGTPLVPVPGGKRLAGADESDGRSSP